MFLGSCLSDRTLIEKKGRKILFLSFSAEKYLLCLFEWVSVKIHFLWNTQLLILARLLFKPFAVEFSFF